MLYLAEVKKQSRGFIGGVRTELKLLACQHNDQTWSPVPGDEILATEELESLGEGVLLMLNLGNNRQIQGQPEVAAPELVRQLQKLSRLSEKLKDQQDEIEQWKQSLTYQSQELSRRETEIESRYEQLEEMASELQQIERRRQEVDSAWEQLQQQQQKLQEGQNRWGGLFNLPPEQSEQLQAIVERLGETNRGTEALSHTLQLALKAANRQQEALNGYWQQRDRLKTQVQQQQQKIEQTRAMLNQRKQELETTRSALEQAKIQFAVQQNILSSKQELLRRIDLDLQTTEGLQETLESIANGTGEIGSDAKIDFNALEKMSLGELEVMVKTLQADLEKMVRFVNDQEEELTLQFQTVQEFQEKLAAASDFDRLAIEGELAEEQERKRMLDQTLIGQRRSLKERQEVLMDHLRVLRRRQGIVEINAQAIVLNLDPVLFRLDEIENNAQQERQKLESEIEHLQRSLQQIQEMIVQLDRDQATKTQDLQREENKWQQAQIEVAQLQMRLSFYEEALQPLQNHLDEIKPKLEELGQWLGLS